jgi:hypothetical protein
MKKLKNLINERRAKLPQDIRDLVSGSNLVEKIDEIANARSLPEWDADALIELTTRLLIGDMAPKEFVPSIAAELECTKELATELAKEINRNILATVKHSLLIIHAKIAPANSNISPQSLSSPISSPPPGPFQDRVGASTTSADAPFVSAAQTDSSSSAPPAPPVSPPSRSASNPTLAVTPDNREPSTLEQKLSSFAVNPAIPPTPAAQQRKNFDPYREPI